MRDRIKVGFCVAYDWYLLEYSIPLIYDQADVICLSLDKNRMSWSGLKYSFSDNFFELVRRIDTQGKIKLLEENFYIKALRPMENEVRQRNRMAEFMGKDGWHIQLDCDEYFIDFQKFIQHLATMPDKKTRRVNFSCAWIILYKKTENGFLYVNPERKNNLYFIQIATKDPNYEYGRRNGNFNICTPFFLLHQSWARSTEEIVEKIENWGHSDDFDSKAYFNKWNAVSEFNYKEIKNFHPTIPSLFPSLDFIKGKTVSDMIRNFDESEVISLSQIDLFFRNSKLISRVRKAFSMIKNFYASKK